MSLVKVKIFRKNDDFDKELLDFLLRKSSTLKRELSIDNILNKHDSPNNLDHLFSLINPIEVQEVHGSTFQSYWRDNDDLFHTSHHVKSIYKDNDDFYGLVEPSPHGEIIDFEKGILKPIYYKPKDKYVLITFDIDFNIT